jgi:predicted CoA-binding protein
VTDPRAVLERSRTVAVVGCSTQPHKVAHAVPADLQRAGFRVIPVNPHAEEVLGERAYRRLGDIPDRIDLVVVFRPPAEAADVVRQAVAAGAGAVWLQSGITSEEGRRVATDAGVDYVEDRCSGVDVHRFGLVRRAVSGGVTGPPG